MILCLFCSTLIADSLDSLDERVKAFFKKCAQPNLKQETKEEEYKKIQEVSFVLFGCPLILLD
jgi:hypothetical protein